MYLTHYYRSSEQQHFHWSLAFWRVCYVRWTHGVSSLFERFIAAAEKKRVEYIGSNPSTPCR